tara:strand:+ start:1281 stop:1436 length:156 start_codon:yes stop_codon:yes gene_type:complete
MKGDNLTYWRRILAERKKDLVLEQSRDEDDNLIKLLKLQLTEAEDRIKELE